MNSRKYWDEEAALRRMAALEDDGVFTTQEIINLYEEAVEDINGEIVKIRHNFLKRFGIDDKTAKFYLTNAQSEENLEMLIRSLEYAPDDEARKAILDFIHRDGLSVRAYSARTERYNALRETIYARMKQLAVRETIILGKALEDTYKKSYYGAVDDIARAANVGINFSLLNDRAVKVATETKWSGKRFSERIWRNTDKLAEKAQDLVVRAIISGESHEKTTRKLQEAFGVAEHNAATLVRTEKAHIMKEADFKAYEDIEIENYMYTALLDYVTCDICQSLDGMVFKTTEAKEGENCPVMHPRCRCTTVADIGPIRHRRAKYPDGKYEIVDGSLTYKEWYNGLPQDKKDAINTARKKNSRKIADTVQHERYKKVLGNKVPKGFDKFQDLKYNDSEKWKELKALYRGVSNGSIIKNANGKYVEIVSHVSLTYKPNAITQKVGKQGGIERNYYDDTGKQFKQISNNNHGNAKLHPFGANGEHTHDYIWKDDKTVIRKDGRELTKTERKENGDIL